MKVVITKVACIGSFIVRLVLHTLWIDVSGGWSGMRFFGGLGSLRSEQPCTASCTEYGRGGRVF